MDFYQYQEQSRWSAIKLAFGFVLALGIVVICLNLVTLGFVYLLALFLLEPERFPELVPYYIAGTTFFTLAVIFGGCYWRISQLKGDGICRLAVSMGAKPIHDVGDLRYRRFRNIVQEMALAAEIPVPDFYILPETDAINAFILGWSKDNTLIAVSEGALTYLSRDELQALVAFEFAHIFNRDIERNLRLIGLLAGLELIYLVGEKGMQRVLLLDDYGDPMWGEDSSFGAVGYRAPSSVWMADVPQSQGLSLGGFSMAPLPILFYQFSFAFFFALIGSIGLIGKWTADAIRQSVCRQREYQSDAQAVQYTRYPEALTSALAKAGALNSHKKAKRFNVSETAHLFFVSVASKSFWSRLSDPHPTIESRLERIAPNRDSEFLKRILQDISRRKIQAEQQVPVSPPKLPVPDPLAQQGPGVVAPPQSQVPRSQNSQKLDFLSPLVQENLKSTAGVKLILFTLFLDLDWFKQQRQKQELRQILESQDYQTIVDLHRDICRYDLDQQIALAVQTMERGTRLGPREYASFKSRLVQFQKPLAQSNLFEIVLKILFETRLQSFFSASSVPIHKWTDSSELDNDFAVVLQFLALRGNDNGFIAREAFQDAAQYVQLPIRWIDNRKTTAACFAEALRHLTFAPGALRQRYLDALVRCIEFDGKITIQERSLISGVRAILGF